MDNDGNKRQRRMMGGSMRGDWGGGPTGKRKMLLMRVLWERGTNHRGCLIKGCKNMANQCGYIEVETNRPSIKDKTAKTKGECRKCMSFL